MKKTFVIRKKDKKVTMVSDGDIGIDEKLFIKKEVNLTEQEFADYMKDARYLFYDNDFRVIYPKDIEDKKLKDIARKEVIESLKNATTVSSLKIQILKLIDNL